MRGAGGGPAVSLAIDPAVVERHPLILVGGVVASGLVPAASVLAGRVEGDLRQELSSRGLKIETLASDPVIADWRAAIAASGLKASTYKGSVEQLVRRTLKSGPVRTGLPLVDVYCDVATRHLAPLGGYDVARLPSPAVSLRLADPSTDRFLPLAGKEGDMPLTPQVVVYAAGPTVLCWAYNCRDSRETCLTEETEVAVFFGEAVTERQHAPLAEALAELAAVLTGAGAAVGPVVFADAGSPAVEVPAP
ncbi:MAG: hypothetical protein M3314_06265 [Actinomycetota bacterium]|nr:hypothetical protein [Actinomycetota bacterium]